MVDRFVASRPDLDAADREMLLGWRDPVEGIFEVRGQAWCYVREPRPGVSVIGARLMELAAGDRG